MNAKLRELEERKKYLVERCDLQRETISLHWNSLTDSLQWVSWITSLTQIVRRHPIFATAATGLALGMQGAQMPGFIQKAIGLFQTARKVWNWWKNR